MMDPIESEMTAEATEETSLQENSEAIMAGEDIMAPDVGAGETQAPQSADEAEALPEPENQELAEEKAGSLPYPPFQTAERNPVQEEAPPQAEESPASAPVNESESENKAAYWRSILTGNPATIPTEVRHRAGSDEWDMPEDQKEYQLLSTVNRSWAADHLPRTREQIQTDWPHQRSELAKRFEVRNNEKEVFMALSQDEEDAPRRAAGERIFNDYYMAALDGRAMPNLAELGDIGTQDATSAQMLAEAAYAKGEKNRQELQGLAERIAHGIEVFGAVEEDAIAAPRVLMAAPDLVKAIDELAELDDEHCNTALYLAAGLVKSRQRGGEEAGLYTRSIQAIRRGFSNMASGIVQGISHTGIATLSNISRRLDSESIARTAEAWDKRMQMLNRMRHLSQDELRPLVLPKEKDGAASYLITAAEAVPSALLSCCGGAGFAALTLGSVGESVAEARERAPLADQELQYYAGLLGGAIQAGIYMNLNRIGGKLLEQSLSRVAQASGKGLAGYVWAGLNVLGGATTEAAKMLTAGKLAAATDLGAQELAARLSNTASNIDWKLFGSNLTDIEANMHEAAGLLPFLLLGSGRVALQHFRSPRAILGDGRMLEDIGIPAEKRKAIMHAENLTEQSELLHEALVASKLWSSLGEYPMGLSRAMNLLHTDSFRVFKTPDIVRDFLQLPPVTSKVVRFPKGSPPHKILSSEKGSLMADAMKMRNRWWKLSGRGEPFELYSPTIQPISKIQAMPIIQRIENYRAMDKELNRVMGWRLGREYIPAASFEADRQAKLNDVVDDVMRLSYAQLMNVYAVDTLTREAGGEEAWRTQTEATRKEMLTGIAKSVVDMLNTTPPEVALYEMGKKIGRPYLDRLKADGGDAWMSNLSDLRRDVFTDLAPMAETYAYSWWKDRPEVQELFHIYHGARTNANTLVKLLPQMDDFQTLLSLGRAPWEAAAKILARSFDLPEEDLSKNIMGGPGIRNVTDMELYTATSVRKFELYQKLMGYDMERTVGDEDIVYYRARRPDGSLTHWHESPEHVANDVAGNALMLFRPFGKKMMGGSTETKHGDVNLMERAEEEIFTISDQLCSIARHDLGYYWMNTAAGIQPRMQISQIRKYAYSPSDSHGLRPSIYLSPSGYQVDLITDSTPLSMAESRFTVAWLRAVESGLITPEMMGNFLIRYGIKTCEQVDAILEQPMKKRFRIKGVKNARQKARERHKTKIAHEMAIEMGRFSQMYFLANLKDIHVPETVKSWIGHAIFRPGKLGDSRDLPSRRAIIFGEGGLDLINWSNEMVSHDLRLKAELVNEIRLSTKSLNLPDPGPIGTMLREMTGLDQSRNYEQCWSYYIGGEHALQSAPQMLWGMLSMPEYTWSKLNPETKELLRPSLEKVCRNEPFFTANIREGADLLESAFGILEEVMRSYPYIHQFGSVEKHPTRVHHLKITKVYPIELEHNSKLEEPLPIFSGGRLEPGFVAELMPGLPGFITCDERVLPCLYLLDAIRSFASNMPHAYKGEIWWKNKRYGYGAKAPAGLDGYEASQPLIPLIERLRSLQTASGRGVKICGVRVHPLDPDLDYTHLQGITIYRSKDDPASTYRLMPGDSVLESPTLSRPYLVHNHNGVYQNKSSAVHYAEDMEKSFMPLNTFRAWKKRDYMDYNADEWSRVALHHNLKEALLSGWDVDNPDPSAPAHMVECLMRLAEDCNFTRAISRMDPATYHAPVVHLLNIMSDMISALCSKDPTQALKRLNETAEMLEGNMKMRMNMVDVLKALGNSEARNALPGIESHQNKEK